MCAFRPVFVVAPEFMGLFTHPGDMFHYSIIYERSFIVGPVLSQWEFSIQFIVLFVYFYVEFKGIVMRL